MRMGDHAEIVMSKFLERRFELNLLLSSGQLAESSFATLLKGNNHRRP